LIDEPLPTHPVSAAILAGGQSRRMGTDKALLRPRPDGKGVLAIVIKAAGTVSDDVFVVAPRRPAYVDLGCRLVPERALGAGPLSGVEAALRAARHDRCLVLACDLPLLSASLLHRLTTWPCDRDALVPLVPDPFIDGGFRPQPLVAVYERRCLSRVSALIDSGERRLGALLDRLDVCFIPPGALTEVDPDLRSFLNLNTPADLEQVLTLLGSGPDPAGQEPADDDGNGGPKSALAGR
jgi:molybdenum cofactor guanylyltransferase